MPDIKKHARVVARGGVRPGLCPICGPTAFYLRPPGYHRDDYICVRCRSIPRQRHFVEVLSAEAPNWRQLTIFESSPGGVSSDLIERQCSGYIPTQWFEGVASGEYVGRFRREDLQALSFDEESVDLVLTQDVFEHVYEPEAGWQEIARVLRPGGLHIWTVPMPVRGVSVARAVPDGSGGVSEVLPAEYHGDPITDGSLVINDWGDDLPQRVEDACGLRTDRITAGSKLHGITGSMFDVLVTRKPGHAVRLSKK